MPRRRKKKEEKGKKQKIDAAFRDEGFAKNANRIDKSFFVSQTWRFLIHGGVARETKDTAERYTALHKRRRRRRKKKKKKKVLLSRANCGEKKEKAEKGIFWQYIPVQQKPRYNVKKR